MDSDFSLTHFAAKCHDTDRSPQFTLIQLV